MRKWIHCASQRAGEEAPAFRRLGGIDARRPMAPGWAGGSHTFTVAHRSPCATVGRLAAWAGAAAAATAITRDERGRATGQDQHPPHLSERPDGLAAAAGCGISLHHGRHDSGDHRPPGGVPLFAELEPAELAQVAEVAVPRGFRAGHVVFREGDQSDTCYVVRSGHARAIREHGDGRVLTLKNFGPGDIFGELAMFDDERRSATVEAIDEVEAIAILGADMRRLLREHPDLAVKLVIALGRRLRETNERLARQSFQTVQSRVATVLAQLVLDARSEGAGARDVLVTATQADLAQLAGSSRESASRFLAVLERAGVISQGRGRLTVHDPAALERYVY